MRQTHLNAAELGARHQAVRDYLAANPDATASEVARATGIPRTSARRHIDAAQRDGVTVSGQPPAESNRTGKSLAEFREAYDRDYIVPRKVREALNALGDSWEYEAEFVRRAGVSFADLGRYRDQFAEHVVVLNRDSRRAWAGTVALAAKMREML